MPLTDISAPVLLVSAFVFGSLWGSFFNVAIYRWPRGMSVVYPKSHCPHCGTPVPPFRNIPIVAYLAQRGKAACCGAKLTPRYVWVEIASGLLATAIMQQLVEPNSALTLNEGMIAFLTSFAFIGALLVGALVDIEWMEIPDEVTLPTAALGLATVGFRYQVSAEEAALGAGIGFLVVQVGFVWGYERLLGKRGMGEGDAKLLLAVGAFLGPFGVIFSLVAGAVQGLIATGIAALSGKQLAPNPPYDEIQDANIAITTEPSGAVVRVDGLELGEAPLKLNLHALMARLAAHGDDTDEAVSDGKVRAQLGANDAPSSQAPAREGGSLKIPFGPFLALAALEYWFFGEQLMRSYLGLFSGE